MIDNEVLFSWNKNHKGLVINAPKGAVCGLYQGVPSNRVYFKAIDINNSIPPTESKNLEEITSYCYPKLEDGVYHYAVSKDGYNAICQVINYTNKSAGMQIDVKLNKMAGNGFESGYIMIPTPEFINAHLTSNKDLWGEKYSYLYNTPQFSRSYERPGRHQQTTNSEIYGFIENISKKNKNVYVFSLGKSPKYNFDMPLVLFTKEDVSGKTLKEAAEIIRNNKKPTIQYSAQVHGNEPVSLEGALSMMVALTSEFGDNVLNNVDVYIIPRINLDGALEVIREAPATGSDMNRDYLFASNKEIRMLTSAYNLFLPEVVIDGHETVTKILSNGPDRCTDLEVQVAAGALNHPKEMTDMAMKIANTALKNARDLGLRTGIYEKIARAAGGTAGSSYFGTRNSISFLIETPGYSEFGCLFMERRVLAQHVMASTVISYTAENSKEILSLVHSSRDKMTKMGNYYDESNQVVISHGLSETGKCPIPIINVITGEIVNPSEEITYLGRVVALKTRTRPTAYVIPKGLTKENEILQLFENHSIPYYALPPKSTVALKQYVEKDGEIALTDENSIIFDNGAYVLPNTVPSTILSVIMEPDFSKECKLKMTLYSMGFISPDESGKLPIYRYTHNLNNGKIDVL